MSRLKVVGIAGQKQNGKDTLADHLAEKLVRWDRIVSESDAYYSTSWGRGSFASEVKRIFCETFMFSPKLIDEWKVKDEPPPGFKVPVRKALMMIGDGFRDIMGDIWIRRAFLHASSYHRVYSDIRYLNEARKIKEVGGPCILICRPDRINFTGNRSESELRPYIQWCESTGREGIIASWPEYQALIQQDGHQDTLKFQGDDPEGDNGYGGSIRIPTGDFIRNLRLFGLFIRNDGTMDQLYSKVDTVVIPYLRTHYGYSEEHGTDQRNGDALCRESMGMGAVDHQ